MLTDPQPHSITWRSMLVGTLAVVLICFVTPLNDFVVGDASLTNGFLPLAAVLVQLFIIVGINAPLHRFAPAHALRRGELAVILLMVLVACSLPNWGLMSFLIPTPVAPFYVGQIEPQFWRAFAELKLPGWLFPVSSVADGRSDDVVKWFFRPSPGGPIPWSAWLVPLFSWGIFVAAMLATLLALARLVINQWVTNERLPFPLAQVQLALIETPPPGRALNDLFRSRLLWVALITILVLHSLSALNIYLPKYFPKVPLKYDFTTFISEKPVPGEPLSFLDMKTKKAAISFIVVGVTFFIRTKVAFSLWGVYMLVNVFNVGYGTVGGVELGSQAWQDQHLGASIAFVGGIAWIGRHYWIRIIRNAFGASNDTTHCLTFWVAVSGIVVMIGWLWWLEVHVYMAIVIVTIIVMAHLVVARVVAETGLPFYRAGVSVHQVYYHLPTSLLSGRDIYFSGVFNTLGTLTTRDSIMGHAMTGMGATHLADVGQRDQRKLGRVMAWALIVGCLVGAPMTLYTHYRYPTPAEDGAKPPRNWFGADYITRRDTAPPVILFNQKPPRIQEKPHRAWLHTTIGFVITAGLEFASLRWTGWPLLPVGYVTSYGAFMGNAWFSVFLGWLAKVIIVRFGGTSLFQKARPLFVGLIFGEALAAALWVIVNALWVLNGGEMKAVKILI